MPHTLSDVIRQMSHVLDGYTEAGTEEEGEEGRGGEEGR